jgi:hypothetical protein
LVTGKAKEKRPASKFQASKQDVMHFDPQHSPNMAAQTRRPYWLVAIDYAARFVSLHAQRTRQKVLNHRTPVGVMKGSHIESRLVRETRRHGWPWPIRELIGESHLSLFKSRRAFQAIPYM